MGTGKRDPRYDPLFEPVKIGPVTAPNRFYQVPHCAGMGYRRPQMMAAMRGMKAAGGWGVVCTEYCSIHSSSDDMPYPHASLWDDSDVEKLRLMTDAVHEHGALAGVELWYGGRSTVNLYTRQPAFGLNSLPNTAKEGMPLQTKAMTLEDIETLKGWYQAAAERALAANFDIVYVYANHEYLLHDFLSPKINTRQDKYGGSAQNRVRLIREIIEETRATVGHRCAVAVRYSIPRDVSNDDDELIKMFSMIAELPDLWDITVNDYSWEMGSSRFVKEASNQVAVAKIKSMTSKPVVSVGRFTSPDTMLSQINSGVQDFIGAARPSIADPFIPQKINQGRIDDIRECIGCNVCYAHDSLGAPIRCTQNPTMGEEWRRGWHADQVPNRHADESVLVIGSGPAGLEAACTLGQRGYQVTLAEAQTSLGGRVTAESQLPGFAEWARVRDWRMGQISKLPNVDVYPDNRLDADSVLELEHQHVLVATGARWRDDGVGRWRETSFEGWDDPTVFSIERVLKGELPQCEMAKCDTHKAHVIIYDDDHYYMSAAIALKLRAQNIAVTLITPEGRVGSWSYYTQEQYGSMTALLEAGVKIVNNQGLISWNGSEATIQCVFSEVESTITADYLMPITAKLPNDDLWLELQSRQDEFREKGGLSMQLIGDGSTPGLIAAAVYSGHKAARELGLSTAEKDVGRRDTTIVNFP
jgi:dimethylamine/trimethylamine dehydrogenase